MRETAEIIRFDQHHPDFRDTKFPGAPTVSCQIYFGGIYCGQIETRSGAIEARSADWSSLGEFSNLDDATFAIMAAADHARQA